MGSNVRTFSTRDAARDYCRSCGLKLSTESTAEYNLDQVDAWIADPTNQRLDVNMLLNTWNMMDDFYKSLGKQGAIPDDVLDLHEKLSLSNFAVDMPGVLTPESYEPQWTETEQTRIAGVLHRTTRSFKNALHNADRTR